MLCKKLPTVCDKVRFGDRIQVRGHDILQTPYPEKSQNNVLASSKCKFSQVEASNVCQVNWGPLSFYAHVMSGPFLFNVGRRIFIL